MDWPDYGGRMTSVAQVQIEYIKPDGEWIISLTSFLERQVCSPPTTSQLFPIPDTMESVILPSSHYRPFPQSVRYSCG